MRLKIRFHHRHITKPFIKSLQYYRQYDITKQSILQVAGDNFPFVAKNYHGSVCHYYKCSNAKRHKGCDKKAEKKDWIEDLVIRYTMKIIMDDALIEDIADVILDLLAQENTLLPQLKARLAETETFIQNMLNAIQQGIFNESTKQRLDELEATKKELQVAIMSEELQRPEITKEHITFWITRFRDIDPNDLESRKRLIDGFINSIYLFDDKIVFVFNFKDGTKEVSLRELEEELSSDLEANAQPRRA